MPQWRMRPSAGSIWPPHDRAWCRRAKTTKSNFLDYWQAVARDRPPQSRDDQPARTNRCRCRTRPRFDCSRAKRQPAATWLAAAWEYGRTCANCPDWCRTRAVLAAMQTASSRALTAREGSFCEPLRAGPRTCDEGPEDGNMLCQKGVEAFCTAALIAALQHVRAKA